MLERVRAINSVRDKATTLLLHRDLCVCVRACTICMDLFISLLLASVHADIFLNFH